MADTKTELCNLAISEIGDEALQLTDFDADTGAIARQCRLHYQRRLEEIIRRHPWNCCRDRVEMVATVPLITDSNDVDFTYNSTINTRAEFRPAADDQSIRWSSTNTRWEYGTWSDPTFTATFYNTSTANVPPETGWVAVGAGTLSLTQVYDWGYSRAHLLPADCIRPIAARDSSARVYNRITQPEWKVEGRTVLSNVDRVYLLYVKEPSIADMDSLMVEAFVTHLASKLAIPISGDAQLSMILKNQLEEGILPEARRVDGFEGEEYPIVDSDWLQDTYNYNHGGHWMERTEGDTSLL